jgi:formate hydrogenlyase transcriptional activator
MSKPGVSINPATLQWLTDYHWPGNVRELEHLVERAMIVTAGATLHVDPNWLKAVPENGPAREACQGLAEIERRAIVEALQRCHGRIYGSGGAAAALGLKPTTLYGKMRKHQIPRHPPST